MNAGRSRFTQVVALSVAMCALASLVAASDPPTYTPVRVRMAEGQVSFWRPAIGDWQDAVANLPLAAGDVLATGSHSRAELQLSARSFLRLGADSELLVEEQGESILRLRLHHGTIALDIRDTRLARTVEITSQSVVGEIRQGGFYRIDAKEDGTRWIARRGGRIELAIGAETRSLGPDMQLVAASDSRLPVVSAAPPLGEWDGWNLERTDELLASRARAPVWSDDLYGLAELGAYGEWRTVPTYGWVWIPRVPRGWVPYSTGRWVWDPFYGWTWVDLAPWGWAPFHYGRWVVVSSTWAWVPGPVLVRPLYAPALVVFFSGSGFHFRLGWGAAAVTWVPLGWGEPCYPWWGPTWFIGKPWWGGWHGPRRPGPWFDHPGKDRDPGWTNAFEHARNRRALVAVARERFGREPVERARLQEVRLERPFGAGELPRRPAPQSDSRERHLAPPGAPALPRPARERDPRFTKTDQARPRRPSVAFPRQEGPDATPPASSSDENRAERRSAERWLRDGDAVRLRSAQNVELQTRSGRDAPHRPGSSWGPFAPRVREASPAPTRPLVRPFGREESLVEDSSRGGARERPRPRGNLGDGGPVFEQPRNLMAAPSQPAPSFRVPRRPETALPGSFGSAPVWSGGNRLRDDVGREFPRDRAWGGTATFESKPRRLGGSRFGDSTEAGDSRDRRTLGAGPRRPSHR